MNVITAAEQRGQGIRAVGSSWSNSDVAASPGVIVQTDALAGVLTEVTGDYLTPAAAGRRLVHVEGGIKLWQLNAMFVVLPSAIEVGAPMSRSRPVGRLPPSRCPSAHRLDSSRPSE